MLPFTAIFSVCGFVFKIAQILPPTPWYHRKSTSVLVYCLVTMVPQKMNNDSILTN